MCNTCGCGAGQVRLDGQDINDHPHPHEHDHEHSADHANHPVHAHDHSHAPGLSQARMVQIERDILSKNDGYARANRALLQDRGVFAVNLVSGPGAGKTTLLVRTIEALRDAIQVAVIEGDQQTSNDADRIRATGAPAVQVNTGKGCHLDAHMVGHALERLAPSQGSVLFIENVGNLVCPAAFDLGEAHKVVILSATEGEDKPAKYPDMFRAASVMLLNKCDLLPHLRFDVQSAIECALRVNPRLEVIKVSAFSSEGMEDWLAWIKAGLARTVGDRADELAALRQRVAELESRLATR